MTTASAEPSVDQGIGPSVAPAAGVRVELLGTTRLLADGEVLPTPGAKLRGILAMLALAGGRVVSVEDILDGVWGEDLPATARNALQYHVTVLRKALAGAGRAGDLQTRDPGYALRATTDVAEFSRLAGEGERAAAAGDAEAAALAFTDALNLWRGEPLDDLRPFAFATSRAVALAEQRLACLEAWVEAEAACGRVEALLTPLHDLVTEHPTRERLWEQLMLALYRTGRQDAALSAFHTARAALGRELGVDPSRRLVALHQAILVHDQRLAPAPAPPRGRPAARSGPAPSRPMTQTILARSQVAGAAPTLVGPSGQRVVLGPRPVVIGRQPGCDLVLHDTGSSRRHAQVSPAGSGYVVEDLGSTNGTAVNGRPVEHLLALTDGDRIEVGHSVVRFVARPGA